MMEYPKRRHVLKIEPCFYESLRTGRKKCEIRLNDRDYQVGDIIIFRPVDACTPYGGEWNITHIHAGLGLKDGYVVLSGEWI